MSVPILTREEVSCCQRIGRNEEERYTKIGLAELDALCDSHERLRAELKNAALYATDRARAADGRLERIIELERERRDADLCAESAEIFRRQLAAANERIAKVREICADDIGDTANAIRQALAE